MDKFENIIKKMFWNSHLLNDEQKANMWFKFRAFIGRGNLNNYKKNIDTLEQYRKQVLSIPSEKDINFCDISDIPYKREPIDAKLIAYYLPQFHPNADNDAWWGRGVTEWNNVGRAVPQYIGHYQPRLPGELGYYDLRLKEVLQRQCELASHYGVYGFAWYFYSFDGKSLLRDPLDMFLSNQDINFPFCLCWANESWTKGFFGSSKEILIEQRKTVESYKAFIHDALKYIKDRRYICIDGRKLLIVYKPMDIPGGQEVINYWREFCEKNGERLYIVGNYANENTEMCFDKGIDSLGEFQFASIISNCEIINDKKTFVSSPFTGKVFDYKKIVNDKIYRKNYNIKRLYTSVSPMWDNTPRRNNQDSLIFDGSTPDLYQKWLEDNIMHNYGRDDIDENFVFINAWNEWGEGAYLEPDKRFGYAYLQATRNAIENCRKKYKKTSV